MYTPKASAHHIDKIRSSADIIEENEGITYLGFCKPGTTETSADTWSIMRITESGALPTLTVFGWAGGSCAYNLVWDQRAEYEYQFKTF